MNTPIPDDRSLIEAVKKGDKQAFSALTKKWYKPIYRYAHGLLRDEHLAAEATQDVFIQAYRAIAKFEHRAKFSTWLYRITRNHCLNLLDYHKRRHRKAHEPLEGKNPERPRELPVDVSNPEQNSLEQQQQALLYAALSKLKPSFQEILLLRDLQELSYEEISSLTELPVGTIKSRLHRARNDLADLLRPQIKDQ